MNCSLTCFTYSRSFSYYKDFISLMNKQGIFNSFQNKIIFSKTLDNDYEKNRLILKDFEENGFQTFLLNLQTSPSNTLEYQNEYLLDIIKMSENELIKKHPYVFVVEVDSPIFLNKNIEELFEKAKFHFESRSFGEINTVQYRFLREEHFEFQPNNKDFHTCEHTVFQPFFMKTDYFIHICSTLKRNWQTLKNLQCELAFYICANTISSHCHRNKGFLKQEGFTKHLMSNLI